MPSTLITSPGSVVNVINNGAGAGLYWNVGSSATLDTTTSFEENIGCTNPLGGTTGTGSTGTGLGGGLTVPRGGGPPKPLPPVSTREPGAILLLGSGMPASSA